MKTIRRLHLTSIFISIIILTQSCVAYSSKFHTLEDASKTKNKVKVYTINNEVIKFKRIEMDQGQFYGVKKIKGDITKTPLERSKLYKVVVKDNIISTIINSTLGLIGALGILALSVWIGDGAN